jgi:hypothetical protein
MPKLPIKIIIGDELLNGEIFYTLKEAQIIIEKWRIHYNPACRPSSPHAPVR